ncbi:MAG: aminopeptidase P family protein [Candidatus Aenigmarchaeota archaeon]|nr:aminopeptidase P family protein [Candidatus Aenigmarchaeota archaeon]
MKPDFSKRIRELRKLVKESKLDALLLSSPRDITYYTGSKLTGDAAFLLVDPNSKPLLIISCLSNYARDLRTAKVRFFSEFKDIVKELSGYKSVGFDEKNMNAGVFMKLKKLRIRLKPFGPRIKIPRMVKDDWEMRQIRKAVKITENLFQGVRLVGRTEFEASGWINKGVVDLGVENAFPPIIASGRNSAFIHYLPGKRKIKAKDFVIMDIGVRFNGYCSDMTRTFCQKPNRKQKKVYEDVLEIQNQVIDNARAGVRFDVLEDFSKKLYEKLGYKKMHSIGHGVGLSVHERPVSKDTIQNGMVFTVEPGVYLKNWGGCRVEDMVYIKNNRARLLSKLSRELTP